MLKSLCKRKWDALRLDETRKKMSEKWKTLVLLLFLEIKPLSV